MGRTNACGMLVVGIALTLFTTSTQAENTASPRCHLHAPAKDTNAAVDQPPAPPVTYSQLHQCSKANQALFQGKGWCHCAFDNPAYPMNDEPNPQPSPLPNINPDEILY